MTSTLQKITPFLWFDCQAEDAARYYTTIFSNSGIDHVSRYGKAGQETHGMPEGTAMAVDFRLEGQAFTALNGGPHFRFSEAISFVVSCDSQTEVDHFWEHLSRGGNETAQRCGWLKDRYDLSWQIVPRVLPELLSDADPARAGSVMQAMLEMKKLDIAALQRAADSA